MNILFFISHQPNPRFVKQINFLSANNKVSLLCFHRSTLADIDDSIDASVTRYNLGSLPNASQPFKRIWTYFKTIKKIRKLIKESSYDTVLINNIDVLLLYVFARIGKKKGSKAPKVAIEISDLREFVFSNSILGKGMRRLERKLYKKYIDKLIVTSKKYYTYHFKKFFEKDVFVLENKLLAAEIEGTTSSERTRNDKTIIGIVGLLLRRDEYIALFEIYKDDPNVEIHVHGKGHFQHVIEEYADKYENIKYFGPYNAFRDARRIYESIDIIYLVYDIDQVSLNNRLALPNKLYECMYYRTPLICSKGTYLEEVVTEYDIGLSINYKEEGAIEQAVAHLVKNQNQIDDIFRALPSNAYFGDEDYKELENFLTK
ncbi:glycosyltransferase [Sungkyunkwania multivorans]|uniref:Glycosyltransferase n=1 Tax=Sungkyunkwania multivorans TaxID=1173618 RepID=A0ABW3CZ75_9FLAO